MGSLSPYIKDGMGIVPLTQNQVAVVDAEDIQRLSDYSWFAKLFGDFAVLNFPSEEAVDESAQPV